MRSWFFITGVHIRKTCSQIVIKILGMSVVSMSGFARALNFLGSQLIPLIFLLSLKL